MTSNMNRSPIAGTGKPIQYAAALTLAVVAGLVACQTTPAEPAPAAALQAGTLSEDQRGRGPMGNSSFRLPEELGLSADQQAEVERIRAELSEKNEPVREQIRATLGISPDDAPRRFAFREMTENQREAVRPALEQLSENHRVAMEQVLAVLTAEQRETLDSLRSERAARWAERRADGPRARRLGGPPFAGGMLRLPSELELTADQQTELERIRTELSEKNEPLHEQIRSTLGTSGGDSPSRSAFREATEEHRDALRPIFEEIGANQRAAMDEVEALLTPEQQEMLESLRAERRSRGPRPGGFLRGRRAR